MLYSICWNGLYVTCYKPVMLSTDAPKFDE